MFFMDIVSLKLHLSLYGHFMYKQGLTEFFFSICFLLPIYYPFRASFYKLYFVLQCKPEYKVPGLYVIDSIVRQSRHQFGHDKDVFAPRFSNNIINTFQNLYRCPVDEKVWYTWR